MAISKVVYGGNTLIDLTADTVSADKVLAGIKAHGADGEAITGTCAYDADTTDATVAAAEILTGKTAYAKGLKVTGTMSGTEDANPQQKTVTPATTAQTVLPDTEQGYNYLSQVTVAAIPYEETENSAGGTTVTIAG